MAQHVPLLEFCANDLPLVSPTLYVSSETLFEINLNPLCKPQDVSYTFIPRVSYFEFIPVGEGNDTIVDLVNVKLGRYYDVVVTNYSGKFYRTLFKTDSICSRINAGPAHSL